MSENERSGDGDANSPTPKRWRVKGHGDDLITYWKSKPPHSNEYAAAEIIEELERELAEAQRLLQDAATQAREVADQAKRIEGKLAQRIASATAFEAVRVKDIEAEIAHIEENGQRVKELPGMFDEGRCRELCAMYLREFVNSLRTRRRLAELMQPEAERKVE